MADSNDKRKITAQAFDAPGSEHAPSGDSVNNKTQTNSATQATSSHARLEIKNERRWWHSQFNLMLSVFALLAVAAGLFIALSPDLTDQAKNVTLVKQDGSIGETKASPVANEVEAPWDEKRRAQARTDSQAVLASLLSRKKALEAKDVQEWALEAYQAALTQAELGDDFYKQQDYRSAIENYQASADTLARLDSQIPAIVDAYVGEGLAAIEQGKSVLATQKFKQALKLSPNNIPALDGLGRAETLDKVLELYANAQQYEQRFAGDDTLASLTKAHDLYTEALTLDKKFTLAKTSIERVAGLTQDKKYRQFMSSGFKHLFAKRYSSARTSFSSALKIKPNDSVANGAYSQSLASNRSASLSSVLSDAKKQEGREQWSQALASYQAVLARDPNQVSAKLGQIRSRARGQLDTQFSEALGDTLSLSKKSVRDKALSTLADGRAILKKGPRLEQQINQLESAIGQLNQSIKYVFSSDEKTQITLLKSGANKIDLGQFKSKKLVLKPGRYVLKGVRVGYQDVRKEIDVQPGTLTVQSVSIRCTEPVKRSASVALKDRSVKS